jgi:malonyl-CoA decarboxylase
MNTPDWIARNVSILAKRRTAPASLMPPAQAKISGDKSAAAQSEIAQAAINTIATTDRSVRSTRDRLHATLRKKEEALSPRVLRRTLTELQAIVDAKVSEVEGGRRAQGVAKWYAQATPAQRRDCWLLMSEQFMADPAKARAAQERYTAAVGTPDEAVAEVRLRQATVSPRRRLLQRFSVFPDGIRFLVDMRSELLPHLKTDKRLQALMEYMFSTWFDVGFLELRRLSWDSPASMIEKLIQYEAVHDIKSWADLKNRLDSDRRCYGFFHPRLPHVPLIFVEVALLDSMASSISPLLDESADAVDLKKSTTAIFYSISNTQPGLKGVSFGDSLIKRVVETLKTDFPKLKTFATLSPIPGLRTWVQRKDADLAAQLGAEEVLGLGEKSKLRTQLLSYAAQYLAREMQDAKPLDPVARFHLGNGARIERINWAGDPSAKGLKQSYGLMVNYLYDIKKLDKYREGLLEGKIAVSSDVEKLIS